VNSPDELNVKLILVGVALNKWEKRVVPSRVVVIIAA